MDTSNPKSNSRSELASRLVGRLMEIGGLLEQESNRILLPFQLNHQQFSILFEIARSSEVRQKDMTNLLHLERAHVSKMVHKLHGAGLISIRPDPSDKRSAFLAATPRGRGIVEECRALFEARKREWFHALETDDLRRFVEDAGSLRSLLARHS